MFNVPTIFYRYSGPHGGMRAIVRGVGKAGEPVARKRRGWPALLAHVERLRCLGSREHDWTTHSLRDGLACKRLANEIWPAE